MEMDSGNPVPLQYQRSDVYVMVSSSTSKYWVCTAVLEIECIRMSGENECTGDVHSTFDILGQCSCQLSKNGQQRNLSEGVDWGNAWKCAFLHSESSHSLPTQPTETILALYESWYCKLHEYVLIHVSHSARKLTGVKAHLDCPNPNWCLSMGKQHMLSHITTHFIFSLDFCNICLLQHHTTQKYAIWWSGWSSVKILWWKVGSTPRKIIHVRPKLLCSSLGANENSEHAAACLWVLSLNIAT